MAAFTHGRSGPVKPDRDRRDATGCHDCPEHSQRAQRTLQKRPAMVPPGSAFDREQAAPHPPGATSDAEEA
jgi:hypothetical protein